MADRCEDRSETGRQQRTFTHGNYAQFDSEAKLYERSASFRRGAPLADEPLAKQRPAGAQVPQKVRSTRSSGAGGSL